jgi:MoaA/NifB/PqqE/SkfB family radical SAM enzyme
MIRIDDGLSLQARHRAEAGLSALRSLALYAVCRLNELTNRTLMLPLLILYPTSRCESRCISCDWWRSSGEDDMSVDEIERLASSLRLLGVRSVVVSGGEPLLRREIFEIADLLRGTAGRTLWLMTSGLSLGRYAEKVAGAFDRAVVSLDASTPALYRRIRGVDGLSTLEAGVERLRAAAPDFPLTARSTLHRANYLEPPAIIDKAAAMGFDSVSFLAADVSSGAFGRGGATGGDGASPLMLSGEEIAEFEEIVERTAASHREAFESGFVRESAEELRRLPQYYAALRGEGAFPPVACSAPWISVVVEADGSVRPCYFQPPVGSVREKPLVRIVREDLRAFRHGFAAAEDPICRRCTCSLKVGPGGGAR